MFHCMLRFDLFLGPFYNHADENVLFLKGPDLFPDKDIMTIGYKNA